MHYRETCTGRCKIRSLARRRGPTVIEPDTRLITHCSDGGARCFPRSGHKFAVNQSRAEDEADQMAEGRGETEKERVNKSKRAAELESTYVGIILSGR